MPHRVECYIHSDSVSQNKGGAFVLVEAQTDFACKTDEFVAFTKKVALLAYGAATPFWAEIIAVFPHIEEARKALESKATGLGEKVTVKEVMLLLPDGDGMWAGIDVDPTTGALLEAHAREKQTDIIFGAK